MSKIVNPNANHCLINWLLIAVLTITVFMGTAFAQDHHQDGDTQYHKHLSVGAFLNAGRAQGAAGGIRFSGTTLSVHAIIGEAPLVVRDAGGRAGLTVRSDGNVYIDRDLVVFGHKKFAQPHPQDPQKVISYIALEGPEAGTYNRGTAQLVDGEAIIELPEHFGLITSEKDLSVMLTPIGKWLQLYVVEKSTKQILIREAQNKTGSFDYLVQGIRKGHEDYQVISEK